MICKQCKARVQRETRKVVYCRSCRKKYGKALYQPHSRKTIANKTYKKVTGICKECKKPTCRTGPARYCNECKPGWYSVYQRKLMKKYPTIEDLRKDIWNQLHRTKK